MVSLAEDVIQIAIVFIHIGAHNVIIMDEIEKDLKITAFNPFLKRNAIYSLNYSTDIDYIYPDKLQNMNQDSYEAHAFAQKPRFFKQPNGEFHGIDVKFMQTMATKQNAKFNITRYEEKTNKLISNIYNLLMFNKTVDMTLNTGINSINKLTIKMFKMINTFDVNGYCAIVPYPPRTSFLGQMLTPFDFYTWLTLIITVGTCAIVWKMFNLIGNGRENLAFYFMFGIIANFMLQSIPFCNNRIIQQSLLQICIFMTFILGNAYQSLIISLISESRYGATIKTFDELMHSNYSLKVDSLFRYLSNASGDITMTTGKMQLIDNTINDINYQQEAANNTALILRCDVANYLMFATEYDSHAIDYFYLIPDQIYINYESFPTSRFSPYYEKLQYFSSLIFESGIRQHWKDFDKFIDIRGKIETNKVQNEEYLLNFDDLFGVFYLLGFGFVCGLMILIMEIFWHDCLKHFKYPMIHGFIMKKKESKMKVRRIQVKPMSRLDNESVV